ncbi:DUF3106 domain-containing protein [bacterium SCSIO 12696]|nr:DUF3106 domain-containing protein [bacterium SCSIO 12696]
MNNAPMKTAAPIFALTVLLIGAPSSEVYADNKDKQHKQEKERKNYKFLSPKQRNRIRDVRERYQDLSPEQQRRLREKWQKQKKKQQK